MGNYYGILTRKVDDKIESIERQVETSFGEVKPIVEKFADDVKDKIWSDIEYYMASDCASNLRTEIEREVGNIIDLLLVGDKQALQATNIISEYTFGRLPEIRQAIFDTCGTELQKQIISDKDEEIENLKSQIKALRDRY